MPLLSYLFNYVCVHAYMCVCVRMRECVCEHACVSVCMYEVNTHHLPLLCFTFLFWGTESQ